MSKLNNFQLIVGPTPPPVGGVSSALMNLSRLLSENSIEHEVFSTSSGKDREDLYSRKGWGSYFKGFSLFFALWEFLGSHTSASVVHIFAVSNSAFMRDFLFIFAAKLHGKKIFIHFHSKTSGEMFVDGWKTIFLRLGFYLTDVVFVLSSEHKKHFSSYLPEDKMVVLENFVFSSDFQVKENEDYLKSPMSCLYVGRLTEKKGFHDLIEAVSICVHEKGLNNLVVHCLGAAETDIAQQKIEELIESNGLSSNVMLHGIVTGEKKYKFFKVAGFLVFPSHFENSPVVLKEAIVANLPIVASDISANKNIVCRSGNGVFFPSKNAREMARCIYSVSSDDSINRSLSISAEKSFKHDQSYALSVLEGALK